MGYPPDFGHEDKPDNSWIPLMLFGVVGFCVIVAMFSYGVCYGF